MGALGCEIRIVQGRRLWVRGHDAAGGSLRARRYSRGFLTGKTRCSQVKFRCDCKNALSRRFFEVN